MHTHSHSTYIMSVPDTTHLSLVVSGVPAVVQHAVTLATQVPTLVTQDQRLRLTVIMVVTQRLGNGRKEWEEGRVGEVGGVGGGRREEWGVGRVGGGRREEWGVGRVGGGNGRREEWGVGGGRNGRREEWGVGGGRKEEWGVGGGRNGRKEEWGVGGGRNGVRKKNRGIKQFL